MIFLITKMASQVIALPSPFQANVTEPLEPLLKDPIPPNCLLFIRLGSLQMKTKLSAHFLDCDVLFSGGFPHPA